MARIVAAAREGKVALGGESLLALSANLPVLMRRHDPAAVAELTGLSPDFLVGWVDDWPEASSRFREQFAPARAAIKAPPDGASA